MQRRQGQSKNPLAVALAALLAIAAGALPARPARAAGLAWLVDKGWPARRVVSVEANDTPAAAGEEIAVVDLPTDGLAADDGRDIRVANATGRAIPFRLLCVGPGSRARVAFACPPGRSTVAIYYGNPKAGPPGKELALEVGRGLLLETATFAGGNLNSADGLRSAFDRATRGRFGLGGLQGADFVKNVFQGHNYFGPSGRTISRYQGFLRIDNAGRYGFATSSDDASFLSLDGQEVVGWGGVHGWVGDARHNNTVELAAGVHRFEYLHATVARNGRPGGGAVAAWKPPGADKWLPIPATAFLPVFRASLGERELFGASRAAEFDWANVGEASIGGRDDYVQRYQFTSRATGFDRKTARFAWRFGDGLTAEGTGLDSVEHIYTLDGPVEVTLTVSQGPASDTVTNRVVVSRNWATLISRKLDPPDGYARLVGRYDLPRMQPVYLAGAMDLFEKAGQTASYLAAGHALATQAQPVDDRVLVGRMPAYVAALLEADAKNGPARAVADCAAAAERAGSPFAKAAMFNAAGRILLDRLENDPQAEAMFRAALQFKDRGRDPAIKAAWIGLGDVHRRRGDGAKAIDAYQQAAGLGETLSGNQAAVQVGSLARSSEFYIRQGDFDSARQFLEDWDWQFPTHKLQGYSTLLWVRYYQARKMHRQAIRQAADLVAAAERSNYAPELLILAADSHLALGEKDRAVALLEHVIAVYRDSPLSADAKTRLAEIKSPPNNRPASQP